MTKAFPKDDRAFCGFMVAVIGDFPAAIVNEIPGGIFNDAVARAYLQVSQLLLIYRRGASHA